MNKHIRQYIGLFCAVLMYYIIHEGAHLIYALSVGVFRQINFMGLAVRVVFLKCRTPKAQRCASHSGYGTRQTLQIYTIDTNVCGNVLSARDGCGSMGTKPRKGDHKNGRFRTEIGKQIAKSMEKNCDRAGGRRVYLGGSLSGEPLWVEAAWLPSLSGRGN